MTIRVFLAVLLGRISAVMKVKAQHSKWADRANSKRLSKQNLTNIDTIAVELCVEWGSEVSLG